MCVCVCVCVCVCMLIRPEMNVQTIFLLSSLRLCSRLLKIAADKFVYTIHEKKEKGVKKEWTDAIEQEKGKQIGQIENTRK